MKNVIHILLISMLTFASLPAQAQAETSASIQTEQPSWEPWDGGTVVTQTLVTSATVYLLGGMVVLGTALGTQGNVTAMRISALSMPLVGALTLDLVGDAFGGDGGFLPTLSGSLGGFVLGALPTAFASGDVPVIGAVILGPALSIVGGLIGYHVSASTDLAVGFNPTPGGMNATVGFRW